MKFKRQILGLVLFVFIFGVLFVFVNNSKAYATSNEETNETKIYWSANDLNNSQALVRKEFNIDNANEPIVETITQNNTISGITLNVTEGFIPENYGEVGWRGRELFNDGKEENGFVFSTELGTITNIRICFEEFYGDYLLKNPSAGWTKKTHTYDYDNTSEYAYEILWEGTPSKEVILRGENIDINNLYGIEFTVKGDFKVSNIEYKLDGGEFIELVNSGTFNNPQTTYIEGVETLLSTNVGNKYGYKFVGWCTDKDLTNDIKTVPANATGDKVYYAKYEEAPKHNIIYHLDGGEFVGEYPNTFYENFSLKLPSNVIKEGVGFYGWKDENESFISEYDGKSDKDLELWAEYRNVYKVTYHLNGGTWPENAKIEYTYTEGIGLTNIYDFNNRPVKDGKNFDGWCTDEELTEPLYDDPNRTGDVELWAKWGFPGIDKRVITTEGKTVYEVDDIKITADNAGDEKGILINKENKISIDVSKVLFKLYGVRMQFNGDLEYLKNTNFVHTAYYVEIYNADAFFDITGYEDDVFELSLKDGNLYVKEISIVGRYITSKISYVLDGGTINEEFETEYAESLGYTLPTNVAKEGLVFTGWFDNENFEGQPIKEITKNDTGDKTFYAYFSNNPEVLVELAENSINNLPEEISLSNKEEILNARNRYEALNDEQKSNFSQEILAKLVAAEDALNTLIAKDVSDNINNLPEISAITYDNKEAIVSAREAYNTLTDAQKAKVSKEALDKLVAAENEIIDIEKSNEVGSQVSALPTSEKVSLDDAESIKEVKEAYDALTDSQKAKLSKETKEKLAAIITEIEALETVNNMVKELPTAENVSLDDLEKVKKAREAYDALTDSQKTKLGKSNNVIIAIEKSLAGLVDDLIVNLGSVDEITLDNKNDILTAREFYESLTKEQKAYVTEEHLNLLKTLEAKCIELQDAFDTEVANDATSDINELPSADEITLDNKEQLDAVKEKYESLTEEQKKKISKETKEKLEAASAEIEVIESVYIKLDNFKTNVSLEDEEAILQARASYNSLTPAQQQKIPADVVDKLESAEETITDIKAINPVIDSIENLGVIIYNSETKTKLDATLVLYNALTDEQKALIADEYKELQEAIKEYDQKELDATRHSLSDDKTNVSVETSTGVGIPRDISLKTNTSDTIQAEKDSKEYNSIIDKLDKGEVIHTVYSIKLTQIVDGNTVEIQPSNIQEGMKLIIRLAIPEGVKPEIARILHVHDQNNMEYVKDVKVEGNEFVFEVSSLSEFVIVVKTTNGLPAWAIVLIVILALILLCGICYLLLFFVFNKWINNNGKKIRVFKLGKKNNKVKVITMFFAIKEIDEEELLNSKDEIVKSNEIEEVEKPNEVEVDEEQVDKPLVDDDLEDGEDETIIVEGNDGQFYSLMYNKSFKAKFIQASDETKNYYQELKNYALSYEGTTSRLSWNYDSINRGRINLIKFNIKRKHLYVYLALNAEEFVDSKYNLVKVESKKYESVPTVYVVKNNRNLKYAMELIDIVCAKSEIQKGELKNENYYLPYEETKTLIEKALIKEVKRSLKEEPKKINVKKSVSASEVNALLSNEIANEMIIDEKKSPRTGKKGIINVSVLDQYFNAGDTVNIEVLKEKKLIDKNVGQVKVLAYGKLTKKLNVELQDYSIEAVKMIVLTGGSVKRV